MNNIHVLQEIQLKIRRDYRNYEYKSIRYIEEEYKCDDMYKKITDILKAEKIKQILFIKMRTINSFIINLEKTVIHMREIQRMLITIVAK